MYKLSKFSLLCCLVTPVSYCLVVIVLYLIWRPRISVCKLGTYYKWRYDRFQLTKAVREWWVSLMDICRQ